MDVLPGLRRIGDVGAKFGVGDMNAGKAIPSRRH
jgi:hypothetical protein